MKTYKSKIGLLRILTPLLLLTLFQSKSIGEGKFDLYLKVVLVYSIIVTLMYEFTKYSIKGMYVVKESGRFSCRGFRCLNVGFFLLKIVVFVFLGTVV